MSYKNHNLEIVKENDPVKVNYLFLIDGVYFQQKGWETEAATKAAGKAKIDSMYR